MATGSKPTVTENANLKLVLGTLTDDMKSGTVRVSIGKSVIWTGRVQRSGDQLVAELKNLDMDVTSMPRAISAKSKLTAIITPEDANGTPVGDPVEIEMPLAQMDVLQIGMMKQQASASGAAPGTTGGSKTAPVKGGNQPAGNRGNNQPQSQRGVNTPTALASAMPAQVGWVKEMMRHLERRIDDIAKTGVGPTAADIARFEAIEKRLKAIDEGLVPEVGRLRRELDAMKNQLAQLTDEMRVGFGNGRKDMAELKELVRKGGSGSGGGSGGGSGSGGSSGGSGDGGSRGGSGGSTTTSSERTTKSSKSGSPWLWALVFVIVLILGCLAFMAWNSYSMHAIHQPWAPVPSQPAQPAAAAPAPQVIYVQPAAPQVVQGQPNQGQGFQPAPVQSGRSRREMPDEGPRPQAETPAPQQGPQLGAKPVGATVPHPYPGEELYRSPPEQSGTLVRAPQPQVNYGQVVYSDYGQSYYPAAYCAPVERMQYVVPVVNPLPLPPAFRGHTRVDPVVYSNGPRRRY